jgi:hypothetical protein
VPNPWDRQAKETSKAYDAFLTYRDLGFKRSVLQAYRLTVGKPEAQASSGGFLKWYKDFRWAERARAWDADRQAFEDEAKQQAKQQAFQAVALAVMVETTKERLRYAKRGIEYGEKCLARGDIILNFPLAEKRVTKSVIDPVSGKVYDLETHWEAMDARMVALAARIGDIGLDIIHKALDHAEALERGQPVSRELSEAQQQKAINKAERLWQEWEAEKKRKRAEANRPQLMPPAPEADEAAS